MKRQVLLNQKLIITLVIIAFFMFAFGFALVPIYNTLCQKLGINGKTNAKALQYKEQKINLQREITVQFLTTKKTNLPWQFYSKTQKIKVHPGEFAKLSFYAENQSDIPMTVQAIPSVTPGLAAKYLKKTECFCFEHQILNPQEGMDMPLLFHIDPELPENIKTLTLSYTLFDITPK